MSISVKNLDFFYSYKKKGVSFQVLKDIFLDIKEGEFLALIGETGSGKSTLVQQLNGLLSPTFGSILLDVDGNVIYSIDRKKRTNNYRRVINLNNLDKSFTFNSLNTFNDYDFKNHLVLYKDKKIKDVKTLRQNIGMVFQFPEYQLFEKDVLTDVCYGPRNFGLSKEEAIKASKEALSLVGLDSSYYYRSPFELSGGEKRKVAIAGIIAMKPRYLVLDEPTVGLDPVAEKNMLNLFKEINKKGTTIILVTHNMDIVLEHATRVCVLNSGRIVANTTPLNLFQQNNFLLKNSIDAPYVIKVSQKLIENGLKLDIKNISNISTLAKEIRRVVK